MFLVLLLLLAHSGVGLGEVSAQCSIQFEENLKCILVLVGSDDVKTIENKTKTAYRTVCAPDYPLDCFTEFEAAKTCYLETQTVLDAPGPLKRQKDLAYALATSCFGKSAASNFLSDLQDIFLPSPIKLLSSGVGQSLWGKGARGKFAPPPIAQALLRGLNVTTPAPVAEEGPQSTDNATDDDQPKLFGRKECTPKFSQLVCAFKELNKLANADPDVKAAISSLKIGAAACKKALQKQCSPSTAEEERCVAEAHIPLVLAFVDNIVACMKGKGYTLPPFLPRRFPGFSKPPKLALP